MKKIEYTKIGYSYVKVSPIDIIRWGGYCICNGCNNQFIHDDMYLVYVLADTYCEKCFNKWKERSKTYKKKEIEEDLKMDQQNAYRYYKCYLPYEQIEGEKNEDN